MNLTACMAQLADSCSKRLKEKSCKAGINNDAIIIQLPDLCRKLCGVGHCDVHWINCFAAHPLKAAKKSTSRPCVAAQQKRVQISPKHHWSHGCEPNLSPGCSGRTAFLMAAPRCQCKTWGGPTLQNHPCSRDDIGYPMLQHETLPGRGETLLARSWCLEIIGKRERGGGGRERERERESKKPCEAGENGMNEKVGWVWVCVCVRVCACNPLVVMQETIFN